MSVNEYTFFPCEHPRLVYNKYIQSDVMVSCGYCSACRSRKLSKYIPLISNESACHKYTYFVTLTYKDEYLPLIDLKTFLPTKYEIFAQFVRDSQSYCEFVNYKLPVIRKGDVQKFLKRLRKLVSKTYGCKIRYFFNGDYGSTTFRPHYHGLFFFDCQQLAEKFPSIVSRAWSLNGDSLGFTDAQVSYGNGQYVAAYTSACVNRPIIYDYCEFSPRPFFSKDLGNYVFSVQRCKEIVSQSLISVNVYDNSTFKYRQIPLPTSLSCRLFPVIPSFGSLNRDERLSIYRLFSAQIGTCRNERNLNLFCKFYNDSFFRDYITLNNSKLTYKQICEKFDRIFYVVQRLILNCSIYHFSLSDYDSFIVRYHFNKFNLNMSNQCHFQELLLHNGYSNEDVNLLTDSVSEQFLLTTPRQLHPEFFRLCDAKLRSLTKSKINHAYLEAHQEYAQFLLKN